MSFAPCRESSLPESNRKSWLQKQIRRKSARTNPHLARVIRPWLGELEARVMLSNWSGPLTSNTTFVNTEIQNIVGTVDVEPGVTLTIQPGTIVQFSGTSLTVDGTLLAQRTASQPIQFTSANSNPLPGDWGGITFEADSTGNAVTHAVITYGGSFGGPTVLDAGGPLTFSNSSVNDSGGPGLRLEQSSALISNISFANNNGPAVSMDLDSNPTVTGETQASFTNNHTNGLLVDGGTLSASLNWNNPDIVYSINGTVEVPSGKTLSIGAGQIIKSGSPSLTVDGTLTAEGTAAAPVVFTSLRDDTQYGDTNNDGGANPPRPADWIGLQLNAGSVANVLSYVDLFYAGDFGVPGIYDNGAPLAISGGGVFDCNASGLRFTQSTATVSGLAFQGNGGDAIETDVNSNPTITGLTRRELERQRQ